LKRLKAWLKTAEGGYCLKCDISKYFDSIDQTILFNLIQKKIKDEKAIRLIEKIICSFNKEIK